MNEQALSAPLHESSPALRRATIGGLLVWAGITLFALCLMHHGPQSAFAFVMLTQVIPLLYGALVVVFVVLANRTKVDDA